VNLTDLSLYSNKVQEIKNLEKLKKLNVFSFGKNLVRQFDICIKYLANLGINLEVLKMADNKFQKV